MTVEKDQEEIIAAASRGDGKLLRLTRSLLSIVSHHRYDEINNMGPWKALKSSTVGYHIYYYAARVHDGKLLMLSRFLISCPKGLLADHKNGNTLFNTDANLRAITRRENRLNAHHSHNGNNSGNEGVFFDNTQQKWVAQLGRQKLGSYIDKEDAIRARITAVQQSTDSEIWKSSAQHQNNRASLMQLQDQKKV